MTLELDRDCLADAAVLPGLSGPNLGGGTGPGCGGPDNRWPVAGYWRFDGGVAVDLDLGEDLRLRVLAAADAGLLAEATSGEPGRSLWGAQPAGPYSLRDAHTALASWDPAAGGQFSLGILRGQRLLGAVGLMPATTCPPADRPRARPFPAGPDSPGSPRATGHAMTIGARPRPRPRAGQVRSGLAGGQLEGHQLDQLL